MLSIKMPAILHSLCIPLILMPMYSFSTESVTNSHSQHFSTAKQCWTKVNEKTKKHGYSSQPQLEKQCWKMVKKEQLKELEDPNSEASKQFEKMIKNAVPMTKEMQEQANAIAPQMQAEAEAEANRINEANRETGKYIYDAGFLQMKSLYSNWKELEQDPKTHLLYDTQGNYYEFTGNFKSQWLKHDCQHIKYLSFSTDQHDQGSNIFENTKCKLKAVKGELKLIASKKKDDLLSLQSPIFYTPNWEPDEGTEPKLKMVFFAQGAYILDVWLKLHDKVDLPTSFQVRYWRDSGQPLPLQRTMEVQSGCVEQLLVGAPISGAYTSVSIKPYPSQLADYDSRTGYARWSKGTHDSGCIIANN